MSSKSKGGSLRRDHPPFKSLPFGADSGGQGMCTHVPPGGAASAVFRSHLSLDALSASPSGHARPFSIKPKSYGYWGNLRDKGGGCIAFRKCMCLRVRNALGTAAELDIYQRLCQSGRMLFATVINYRLFA